MSMAGPAMLERARAATPTGENDIVFAIIPLAHIPVLNAFYRRRQPFFTTIAGRQVSISLAWRPFEEHAAMSRRLLLRIDGEDAELSLARSLLDMLLASVDPRLSLDRVQPDHALRRWTALRMVSASTLWWSQFSRPVVGPRAPNNPRGLSG